MLEIYACYLIISMNGEMYQFAKYARVILPNTYKAQPC